ncbi:protein of unknown function [Bradyrhizobium vignae]|uniref:Uncharacterized protein n=1 Tax=Bradyrhizobium vignae TaxID=1549949 RepID=A0A2U3PU97_9BRAD|nr:protein of unknown function [Bradyrhizobium vignae]
MSRVGTALSRSNAAAKYSMTLTSEVECYVPTSLVGKLRDLDHTFLRNILRSEKDHNTFRPLRSSCRHILVPRLCKSLEIVE